MQKFCIVSPGSKKTRATFSGQDKVVAALFGGVDTDIVILMIANEPKIYTADLSMIVSKYIGETEKNLSRLLESLKIAGQFFSSTRETPSLAREQRSRTGMQISK